MQKDLLLKDVNQQLPGREFDNCSFYRLEEPNTYLCIHKADCWENSFVVFQENTDVRVINNKGELAKWFNADSSNSVEGTEVTSIEVSKALRNEVSKCLEKINSK